ncbi:MAG TPA: L-2-hydroxyglutarate oxidase [Candidatus Limnocylindrales bacterium]|nr:L-2-hydroxyglutarate oxidase [Candidatus Limnocylindrales bacterium]
MTDRFDVVIVGGGIVGLATALRLTEARPGLRIAILEKEAELATHQSGHNSGVLHAGLYYAPGSLKARLCREGKAALEAFAEAHGIPFDRCGKLVLALDETELERLAALRERAVANGVPGLEEVGPERIRELEPHAAGIRGLWSPETGIIDFRRVALAMADDLGSKDVEILTGREVRGLDERPGEVIVTTPAGEVRAGLVVACAGLQADRVAALSGARDGPRIVPFRGDYYTLTPDARDLVRGLIYPVPDPRFPFLGVHFTKRINGEVWAGPNAVLAFAREGYRRRDIGPRDLLGTLADPGFLRLASRYLRTGLGEMWRDWWKPAFVRELQRYVPEIRADQLRFGPSGVRAQALARDGTLVDDFVLGGSDRILHVRNAPSPAATSSLAIGAMLATTALERLPAS